MSGSKEKERGGKERSKNASKQSEETSQFIDREVLEESERFQREVQSCRSLFVIGRERDREWPECNEGERMERMIMEKRERGGIMRYG